MIIHTDIAEAINAFFQGVRSLGIASQGLAFFAGIVFAWFSFWLRRKFKIG